MSVLRSVAGDSARRWRDRRNSPRAEVRAPAPGVYAQLASVLENTVVGAYNGAAPSLKSKEVLLEAGSIVQVEARHAAAIDLLLGASPTPSGGFDVPLAKAEVLEKAGPLIKD